MTHNVPAQSLIDHIKTAIDVDPWAKEMVENLLKEQEHKDKMFHALEEDWKRLKAMLKEQEAEIRQYKLALKIMKGEGFCAGGERSDGDE